MAERLQKFLASAGVASRRKAEALIAQGRVKVNARPVTAPGLKVDPERDLVTVDGRLVAEGPFREIWIQPASTDAGGALGAALWAWHETLGEKTAQVTVPATGEATVIFSFGK